MPHFINFSGSPIFPPFITSLIIASAVILIFILIFLLIHFRNPKLSFRHKFKEFLIWALFLIGCAVLVLGYVLLSKPKTVSANPAGGSKDVDPKSSVSITFDKPVGRRSMEKTISPDVPGTWVFEDPLYTTHLYRKVSFYPDSTLNAGTNYEVKLTGIENTLETTKPYEYEFSFATKADAVIQKEVAKVESKTVKLDVPSYLQQHTLSCEVSSLRMALAYKGINKSEDELLTQVGVDNTPHVDGTWGNPYQHFVGNVNGNQLRDGYGVYWDPIARVASIYGRAEAFQNGDIRTITRNIDQGNPLIVWVYSENGSPTHWKTPDGVDVFAVAGEHTVVVVGYVGPADNPEKIIVNDSLVGQSYWSRSYFDHKWATFSEAGVIIYK